MERILKINRYVNLFISFIFVLLFFLPIVSWLKTGPMPGTEDVIMRQENLMSPLQLLINGVDAIIIYLICAIAVFALSFFQRNLICSIIQEVAALLIIPLYVWIYFMKIENAIFIALHVFLITMIIIYQMSIITNIIYNIKAFIALRKSKG